MPAVYAEGELDVVGFVTGVVEREKVITGSTITEEDVVYGVSSSGLHTNGWSLARKLFFEIGAYGIDDRPEELGGLSLADVLLEPHANYVMPIRRALEAGIAVKGMAHITGGGLIENVPRILPSGLGVVIDTHSWDAQPIFAMMQRIGSIEREEMHRVFNMGVGLVVIAPAGLREALAAAMAPFHVWEIGRVDGSVTGTVLRAEGE
jgi:phosphoribosylformylglycinamidine cyclo-ligase